MAGAIVGDALGAELRPLPGQRCRVRVYLAPRSPAEQALALAHDLLARRGLDAAACGLELSSLADGHWVEAYQSSLTPLPLGRGFTIYPTAEPDPADGRIPILLVPGRAFGTGDHATTRLCAEGLERHVRSGSRWLDLGCGTAILSIVARHLGAAEVVAVDIDPDAVAVASEVLERNALAGEVEVRLGSLSAARTSAWDGVVANIAGEFFVDQAASLRQLLAPGGRLLASGFLEDDVAWVSEAFQAEGLRVADRRFRMPWALLEAQR